MKRNKLGQFSGEEPTEQQKRAVDNILSGKFVTNSGKTNLKQSMLDAGYEEGSARVPSHNLAERKGVQVYMDRIANKVKTRYGMELRDKVMDVYVEGLDATKITGKDQLEVPDFKARIDYADRFAEFFGWSQEEAKAPPSFTQYNFFSVDEEKREKFNANFKGFLKKFYQNG